MTLKKLMLLTAGAATIAIPAVASAQAYDQQGYYQPNYSQQGYGQDAYGRRDYRQRDYGQDHGDFDGARRPGSGIYPQFRSIEAHIRQEIREALRDDAIEPDDARDLMQQLRGIQSQEMREYRVHGWNLPYDDQVRIRAQLSRLDRQVDQTRNEP